MIKKIKRYEFIEKVLYLIRKKLEQKLPLEATLKKMIDKYREIIKNIKIGGNKL